MRKTNKRTIEQLKVGDRIDLYGDKYADPNRDPALGFQFQLATVLGVERETNDCWRVDFDHDAVGFHPWHVVTIDTGAR